MQRQLTSFDISIIVQDLQEIIDSPIDKSYQLSSNEILIKFKNRNTMKKETLFIRNGKLIALTDKQLKTPKTPSNFVMALRKYIQNGRIVEIVQHEFDRIIMIKIGKKTGIFTLVIEFFSEGNIILVDEQGYIIIPFIQQAWAHRKVKGRQPYTPPPSQINPFDLSKEIFAELIRESNADIVRTLAVKLQLSGPIAEEICTQTTVKKETLASQITDEDIKYLYKSLQDFLNHFINNKYNPMIIKNNEKIIDILPFPFKSYNQQTMESMDHFTRGLSKFIEDEQTIIKQKPQDTKTDKTIGKLTRMLNQQQEKITILDKTIEQKQREGEIIYFHYNKVNELLCFVQQKMNEKEKTDAIQTINALKIVKEFNPKKNTLIISLPDINNTLVDIPLLFRKTVSENAEHAYDESKKAQKKKQGAETSVGKTQQKLKELHDQKKQEEQKQQEEDQSRFVKKKRKQHWFERYRWTISSDGNLILGGKDAKTNDQLVKKHLEIHDRYVHADIHGAPSCIVKKKTWNNQPCEISEKTMEEACLFAACYSRAWKQFTEAQSYWVLPNQVSKTPQSGEYLPKGAFIIRGNRTFCKCILEMGIGLLIIDEEKRWIGGSIDSIKKWCDPYIIIKPGNISRKDFSHMIAKQTKTSVDDINHILPPGGISIIEKKGFDTIEREES